MGGGWTEVAASRRWLAAFAVLALLVQALLPQGYMVSATSGAPPSLVICTGHGPLVLNVDHGAPAKPAKSSHDAPCIFAGHGPLVAAAPTLLLRALTVSFVERAVTRARDLLPGRGLAAPPPPSQGPPLRSV
jgi:hypothetical protein